MLVLVDADGEICIPHFYLLDPSNLRVLLTSSPRRRKDRRWLTQSVVCHGTMVAKKIPCSIVRLFF